MKRIMFGDARRIPLFTVVMHDIASVRRGLSTYDADFAFTFAAKYELSYQTTLMLDSWRPFSCVA